MGYKLNSANSVFLTFNLLFLIILIALVSLKKLPLFVIYVYLINFVLCAITWEIFMSFGVIEGESVEQREEGSNNIFNMFMMSMADAIVGFIQIYVAYKIFGKKGFDKWNWKVFGVIFGIGMFINILVTIVLKNRLKDAKLSYAPFMPVQTNPYVQNQEPWIIQPFVFYGIIIALKIVK